MAAASGLRRLATFEADVVLTDLSMPGMDGWTVAREVRERRPLAKVLLVTGYGASIEPFGEKATLVDGVVCKPFEPDHLESLLTRLCVSSAIPGSFAV